MKALLQILKPTPLAGLILVLGLLTQATFFSPTTFTFSLESDAPDRTIRAFGLGATVMIASEGEASKWIVRWGFLVLNLAATYALAVLLAAALAKAAGLRRPAMAFSGVTLVMIGAAFLVSIGVSKAYWGYFISRPALFSEVNQIATVNAVVPFTTESDESGRHRIVPDASYSVTDRIAQGKSDSHYCLHERILIALQQRNLLPTLVKATLDGLPDLRALISGSGRLTESSDGYNSSAYLSGVVVDANENSGGRLLVLGFTGGQVSNDHYPYYELMFREDDGGEFLLIGAQHFFYDAAGIEGVEWFAIWALVSIPAIALGFIVFTIARLIGTAKRGAAQPAQHGPFTPSQIPTPHPPR